MTIQVNDASAMEVLGGKVAQAIQGGEIIYLKGDLGAGKTTWVRGFLTSLGHQDKVKSPTYTLVEPYQIAQRDIYHFDLYRVNDPEELEAMGIRDYCDGQAIALIEWPEQGQSVLPKADLTVSIQHASTGREVTFMASTESGKRLLSQL